MCLPIDCWLWLCMPRTVDDDPAPARRTTQHAQRNHYNGNSNGNGNGAGHQHHHNGNGYTAHSSMAAAEADRKTSNDVRRGAPAHHAAAAAAPRGAQEKAAAYPYAGADETTLKHLPAAAWNGRVAAADGHGAARGGGAPRNYYSYERAQPAAHGEDAAADYHYMAATATADHERY